MKYIYGTLFVLLLILISPFIIGIAYIALFLFGPPLTIGLLVIGTGKLLNFLYLNSFGGVIVSVSPIP